LREDAADGGAADAAAAAAEDELDADTWRPLDLQAVTQTGGAPRGAKDIRHHRAHKHTRHPPTRQYLGEDARATGMEDTGEDADARLPRVVLPHRHRGYKRDGGHGHQTNTKGTEHDHKKNKRAHMGEDATGEDTGSSDTGCRCRLEWRQST